MIRNILVPIDYQDLSAHAVGVAVDLARSLDARLHLLYVAPASAFESLDRHFLDDISSYLHEVQREFPDVVADRIVTNGGPPATIIVQKVSEMGADLVVVSTHARHGPQRWIMGSVTEALMGQSPCPVLVVNAHSGSPVPGCLRLRRILVPVDGSSYSEQALAQAGDLARTVGAQLSILHVIKPSSSAVAAGRESSDDGRRCLAPLHVDGMHVETHLAAGNAADVIVQAGQHADLIVMATHGRSGPSRLLLGSTTARVVSVATAPVLVLTRSSLAVARDPEQAAVCVTPVG
jgi:nucleotide-binding universal stress UspA family protein